MSSKTQMPIGGNGLHMPIGTVYFKVGVLSKTVPYMIKTVLNNIPVKC